VYPLFPTSSPRQLTKAGPTGRRAVAQFAADAAIAPAKRIKTRQHENFQNRINGTTAAESTEAEIGEEEK